MKRLAQPFTISQVFYDDCSEQAGQQDYDNHVVLVEAAGEVAQVAEVADARLGLVLQVLAVDLQGAGQVQLVVDPPGVGEVEDRRLGVDQCSVVRFNEAF